MTFLASINHLLAGALEPQLSYSRLYDTSWEIQSLLLIGRQLQVKNACCSKWGKLKRGFKTRLCLFFHLNFT